MTPTTVKKERRKPVSVSNRDRSDRDRLLQISALVAYRLEEIRPDDHERGFSSLFGSRNSSEIALLNTIDRVADIHD